MDKYEEITAKAQARAAQLQAKMFEVDVQAALVELQAASWARSWSRVKQARKAIKDLIGLDVPGPFTLMKR